ncbi:MAG: NAD(P)-dependent alcohol dehydrogenase [Bacteroidota bacterium]
MRAITYNQYGSADVLETVKMARPIAKADQVLVRIHAAALNPIDYQMRRGRFHPFVRTRFPRIPGSDFAGIIAEIGSKVTNMKVAEEVYGMAKTSVGGSYAEYIAIHPAEIARKPASISFVEAASLPLAALTSLQALRDLGNIRPGMQVLINGASGGVGVFGVQLAKTFGASVTAVCSHRNVELVKALGADRIIDYTQQNIRQLDDAFDIFYDAYGNQSYSKIKHLLTSNGRYISTIPSLRNFRHRLFTFFSRKKARVVLVSSTTRDLDELRMLVEAGELRPVIDQEFLLEQAREASLYLETRRAKGKVVLTGLHP